MKFTKKFILIGAAVILVVDGILYLKGGYPATITAASRQDPRIMMCWGILFGHLIS